jgi:hypothetical protein
VRTRDSAGHKYHAGRPLAISVWVQCRVLGALVISSAGRLFGLGRCASAAVRRAAQLFLSPLAPECDGSECCDAANLCSIVFSRNQKRIRKSLVCLIRSLRTVTSLSIAAASVLSRRSVSIWFGPAFKICFIISNVLSDLATLSIERYEQFRSIILRCAGHLLVLAHPGK